MADLTVVELLRQRVQAAYTALDGGLITGAGRTELGTALDELATALKGTNGKLRSDPATQAVARALLGQGGESGTQWCVLIGDDPDSDSAERITCSSRDEADEIREVCQGIADRLGREVHLRIASRSVHHDPWRVETPGGES